MNKLATPPICTDGGRHQFMVRGEKKIRIPNPHGSGDVHISLVKEILRQAGISETEWEEA